MATKNKKLKARKQASKNATAVSRSQAMAIAQFATQCESLEAFGNRLLAESARLKAAGFPAHRGSWRYYLERQAKSYLAGKIPGEVFKSGGNRKLPFFAWSTLPIVTCPGAGDCVNWCYSLKAWRYPAAFLRQAANTLRLRFAKRSIIEAVQSLPPNTTVRLYVDGDFDCESTAIFWANLMRQRPDVDWYGYSKSLHILAAVGELFPPNYALNLSSGSMFPRESAEYRAVAAMPFTRGEFLAIPIAGKHPRGFARYQSAEYHREVRKAAKAAGLAGAFSCPGDCGPCGHGRHMCGRVEFHNPIVIGIH